MSIEMRNGHRWAVTHEGAMKGYAFRLCAALPACNCQSEQAQPAALLATRQRQQPRSISSGKRGAAHAR